MQKITRIELLQVQVALLIAIALQVVVWRINHGIFSGPQALIVGTELALALTIGFTVNKSKQHLRKIHHNASLVLLALISAANISSLIIVLQMLVVTHVTVNGLELLSSAVAIFMTNIIVFALWYWEVDSPGLTQRRWSHSDKDFQFIQQDMKKDFKKWHPEFGDYLYLSLTNAINFAPADTRPLTKGAKLLMGAQALVSVFTLALVLARSVSILGS
jgi:uncharacterized membrane protein